MQTVWASKNMRQQISSYFTPIPVFNDCSMKVISSFYHPPPPQKQPHPFGEGGGWLPNHFLGFQKKKITKFHQKIFTILSFFF